MPCLLQKDYGYDNDCTLTSISALIKYYKPNQDINTIYNGVEKNAKKIGYSKLGTPIFIIGLICRKALWYFNISKIVHRHFFKNIGYSFDQIQSEVDQNHPILLNLWNDGRDYYTRHSVLIVGYLIANNKRFLAVYDNWNYEVSYIDYDKLSLFSNIVFLKDK